MKVLFLATLMTGSLALAGHSKTPQAVFPEQTTKDFSAGTANDPAVIRDMNHAPDGPVRTTRTAGRNQDADSGMAAPVEGSVIKGMRDNAYTGKHIWQKRDKSYDQATWAPMGAPVFQDSESGFTGATTAPATTHTAVTPVASGKSVSYCTDAPKTGNNSNLKADDQPQNERDVALTREVRRNLMARKDLSTGAHNLTLVSENCLVTIRGTVPNAGEKATVEQIARNVAGVGSVKNLIQVAR